MAVTGRKNILLGVVLASCALVGLFVLSVLLVRLALGERLTISSGPGVGYVEVKGVIVDAEEVVKQLHALQKNDDVRAVVLRIDSPGGVVGPSQEIYQEVKKLAAVKKVVVSMGSVAASGGYYIAVPATTIYANPGTITGSIGVLMKLSNIEGLLGKVGMKAFILKSGEYKDSGSPLRPLTAADRAVLQGVIDNLHDQFIRAVAEGRKLPLAVTRKLADGRVYTGEQALGLKLVDRLGTLQDAVTEAGRLAGIVGEPTLITPPRKPALLRDLLVEELAGAVRGAVRQESRFSVNYQLDGPSR
ncbi:multidrug transporter [Geotalea uraniireducens]|uniref:Multidrug transporter n=1 Tax=Geotalea uraniireducens TaxID=351604 RepID=A0ABM8EK67_9BACT|nr:signal peptide peptidase SppA [Geotalea uraniireducens]BDV42840.1 multidrug transporter [Geotalea uraniireducens]